VACPRKPAWNDRLYKSSDVRYNRRRTKEVPEAGSDCGLGHQGVTHHSSNACNNTCWECDLLLLLSPAAMNLRRKLGIELLKSLRNRRQKSTNAHGAQGGKRPVPCKIVKGTKPRGDCERLRVCLYTIKQSYETGEWQGDWPR
jgi:hypothetical protein